MQKWLWPSLVGLLVVLSLAGCAPTVPPPAPPQEFEVIEFGADGKPLRTMRVLNYHFSGGCISFNSKEAPDKYETVCGATFAAGVIGGLNVTLQSAPDAPYRVTLYNQANGEEINTWPATQTWTSEGAIGFLMPGYPNTYMYVLGHARSRIAAN